MTSPGDSVEVSHAFVSWSRTRTVSASPMNTSQWALAFVAAASGAAAAVGSGTPVVSGAAAWGSAAPASVPPPISSIAIALPYRPGAPERDADRPAVHLDR